jgi:hypothetical protein
MGIRWEPAGSNDQAPFLVCDACGAHIVGHGRAVFDTDADGRRIGRFRVLHARPQCHLTAPDTRTLPSLDLAEFLRQLTANAHLRG